MKKNITFINKISSKGFTLVEILLYFALVSLLFIQLTSLFITVLEAKQDSHATSAVERDGQFILSRLTYDIQRADAVVTPASLGQQSTQLQLTINGSSYIYSIVDGQLLLNRSGEILLLSSNIQITDFLVTRLGNVGGKHSFQISFTATSPIQEASGQESRVYQTTIGVR